MNDQLPSDAKYTVEPVYKPGHADADQRPYIVKVNGTTLMNNQHNPRRFKNSMTAAVAGAKEVDRLKAMAATRPTYIEDHEDGTD